MRLRWLTFEILAVVTVSLVLSPLLWSGLAGDDAYNSLIRGAVIEKGVSIEYRYVEEIKGWFLGAGRFVPLGWLVYFYYYFIDSVILTKFLNLTLIVGSTSVWIAILKNFGLLRARFFFPIFLPVFLSFKTSFDPILAFSFLLPSAFLTLSFSILSLQLFVLKKRYAWFSISLVSYCVSCFIYEIGYVFFWVYPFIILGMPDNYLKRKRRLIWSSFFISFIGLLFVFGKLILGYALFDYLGSKNVYPGATPNLDGWTTVLAFFKQTMFSVNFPYSVYRTFDALRSATSFVGGLFISFASLAFGLLYWLSRNWYEISNKSSSVRMSHFLLAIGFILCPAALVSVSGHRNLVAESSTAVTYLPVFFQYFGWSLLSSVILDRFVSDKQEIVGDKLILGTLSLLSLIYATTFVSNVRTVKLVSDTVGYQDRVAFENFDIGQLLDNSSILLRTERFPHDHLWNYLKIYGDFTSRTTLCDRMKISTCSDFGVYFSDNGNDLTEITAPDRTIALDYNVTGWDAYLVHKLIRRNDEIIAINGSRLRSGRDFMFENDQIWMLWGAKGFESLGTKSNLLKSL